MNEKKDSTKELLFICRPCGPPPPEVQKPPPSRVQSEAEIISTFLAGKARSMVIGLPHDEETFECLVAGASGMVMVDPDTEGIADFLEQGLGLTAPRCISADNAVSRQDDIVLAV